MGNSRFSDGFLLGAVAGGALVFLVGTKKGNEVLKIIMEEGRASLGDLMDEIEDYKEDMKQAQIIDDGVDEVVEKVEKVENVEIVKSEPVKVSNGKEKSSKRFFKKSK